MIPGGGDTFPCLQRAARLGHAKQRDLLQEDMFFVEGRRQVTRKVLEPCQYRAIGATFSGSATQAKQHLLFIELKELARGV